MKRTVMLVAASLGLSTAIALAQSPNDAQIASIVVTANQVDIEAGELAKSTSTNADVKQFAQLMITDHTGVNKSAVALVTNLKKLKGADFDKAYIDHEVAYHQQVLDAVDKTLIPSAQNAELKALLVKVRPAFVAHLEHAKHVQATLG